MNPYFSDAFSIFFTSVILVGGCHLYTRFFISDNIKNYNWLTHRYDFKYLNELKGSDDNKIASKAKNLHALLKIGYIVTGILFVAVLFLSDFNT